MKHLKLSVFLIVFLTSINIKAQEAFVLPFFDDFEEPISNDAIFTKWTAENLQGWHYWHLIPGGGNGGQCMRFENTDIAQNDWLITKPVNCAGVEKLKVNFNHLFRGNKAPPKLYYTSQYNGNASQSTWKELSYWFGANENQWYASQDFIIENPGNVIYFAFHYQAAANAGAYFLLDNFSVKSYTLPATFVSVGNSEHFEFYTNIAGNSDYHLDIKDVMEKQFEKLSSLWDRPGIENVFNENRKIKVYYADKKDIDNVTPKTPNWKCGFHNTAKLEIYLSPLSNPIHESYYSTLQNLAINEFSQLAITKRCSRENYINLPPYFLEGFGLYESGFRPRRDSIVKYLNENQIPDFNFVRDTSGISNSLKKDLVISNIEGQILTPYSYFYVGEGASSFIYGQWPHYLNYFYKASENERIKLLTSTANFDFYGTVSDSTHHSELVNYFENPFSFYKEKYNYAPRHRFNVVICPNDIIGGNLTGWGLLGGAGCHGDLVIQLSPNSGSEADYEKFYAGMSAHEFFHIYYNHFMWQIPGGFWAEGSADFSARHSLGEDIRRDRFWMIEWTFNEYAKKYNIELDLAHISTNPNLELDIYYLGDMFFEYLYQYHGGFEKIKEFFNQGMDYSVFNATYEEIDSGYINYLKGFIETNYQLPAVVTEDESDLTTKGATLHGENTFDGGTSITQRGFYWSSSNTIPNSGDHVEIVSGTTGSFRKTLENLTPETTYYFRAFATNSVGTALGVVKQFKTLALPVLTELPFFDDFEETISNDATFTKWTTENLQGWHYWHIIPGGGNGGQCMRFENTDLNQSDWLVTKPINCAGVENLNVSFNHLFHANKVPPKLYYTNQYNGNASQSTWKELSYSFGANENQWYASQDFIIDNPGDVLYFAFHYQAAANTGAYFLLDNFSVQEITTGVKLTTVLQNDLKVYPNPKTDNSIVSFTTNIHENVTLAIYDLKGRKLFTLVNDKLLPGMYSYPIDIYQMNPGLYLVSLSTSLNKSFVKLIVAD